MITSEDLVEFIKQERRDTNAFRGYTDHEIVSDLMVSATVNGLCVVTDRHDNVLGVLTSMPDIEEKTLHISNVVVKTALRNKRTVIKEMLKEFYKRFSAFTIIAIRRNKHKVYNTKELLRLLKR